MEIVQLTTTKGKIVNGDTIIYTGDFAIVQEKTVKDGKVIISHTPYSMGEISSITRIVEAEKRELLLEEDGV
jgi:hypothetical protein